MSSYTLFIVIVTIYYHHIAMICFSYHVIYHIHLICVYLSFAFMFHVCINLRSGYEKELYVPEGTITIRDGDLYLYDPNGAAIIVATPETPARPEWRIRIGARFTPTFSFILSKHFIMSFHCGSGFSFGKAYNHLQIQCNSADP